MDDLTKERPTEEEIARNADELARLSMTAALTKSRIDVLKGWFETLAMEDLKDKKEKTAEYWGNGSIRITVANSNTVKPASMTMLKTLFGDVFGDFAKEEVSYKLTEPCKRLLAAVSLGDYTEGDLERTIPSISTDPKVQNVLRKKLKGRYQKDRETLRKNAGLSLQEASDWAYLIEEVLNWERLIQVLKASGWSKSPQEAVDLIRTSVIVEEGIKVTVEQAEG